jgi:uncharacterized repeat protein (TIGR01451 family)
MQGKLKFRFYVLLFGVAIFILTAVGLAVFFYKTLPMPFWLFFVYVFAWGLVFAFAFDVFVVDFKLGWEKFLFFILIVMVLTIPVTHSVWVIVTPKWSFSVTTDKSTYTLGENVTITVSLRNMGFITHSFESSVSDPVVVSIEYQHQGVFSQVWYSPYSEGVTEFSIAPNQSLERNFIWNQTNTVQMMWNRTCTPGTYNIYAVISDAPGQFPDPHTSISNNIFIAYTSLSIIFP